MKYAIALLGVVVLVALSFYATYEPIPTYTATSTPTVMERVQQKIEKTKSEKTDEALQKANQAITDELNELYQSQKDMLQELENINERIEHLETLSFTKGAE